VPDARLVVAGGNHPQTPGYVESIARRFANEPRVVFVGYVPEELVPDLFRSASVAVMPYSSSTGSSGIAHLACAYGVPIVSADLPDFRQMAEEEGLAIDFYPKGDAGLLADRLIRLLRSPERQREMAEQNFSAALRMTMPRIIQDYVRHFGFEQRNKALKSMMRLRQMPRWLAAGLLAGRLINHLNWSDRPFAAHLPRGANANGRRRDGHGENGRHRANGDASRSNGAGYSSGRVGEDRPDAPAEGPSDTRVS
jgi:hypothetical protein